MNITVSNNVTGNMTSFDVINTINLGHLAKAFDLGLERKVIPLANEGVVVMYANGYIRTEPTN